MEEHKNNHFVPQTYMKRFITEPGQTKIHMLKRDDLLGKIIPVGLDKVCSENALYSIAKPGQPNDPTVEKLFDKVFEKHYSEIYKAIVINGQTEITGLDRYSLVAWITSMIIRNSVVNKYLHYEYEDDFEIAYNQAISQGKQSFLHRNHTVMINGMPLERLKTAILPFDKAFINASLIPIIKSTTEQRLFDSFLSLVTLTTEAEFITSDFPVTLNTNSIEGVDRSMPLDSKHLIIMQPNHENIDPNRIYKVEIKPEEETVYALKRNRLQTVFCSRFMLGNKIALTTFQDQIRPGYEKL